MDYGNPALTPSNPNKQSENLQMASEIAQSVLSRFSLQEQNDFVAHLTIMIREARIRESHELQERIEIIGKSLEGLTLPVLNNAMEKRQCSNT